MGVWVQVPPSVLRLGATRLAVDRPHILEQDERHRPAGLDVDGLLPAAVLLQRVPGVWYEAQDGDLPHRWPFRYAMSVDRIYLCKISWPCALFSAIHAAIATAAGIP